MVKTLDAFTCHPQLHLSTSVSAKELKKPEGKKVDWAFNKISSEASGEVLNDVSSINKKAKQQISKELNTKQSSETEHMVVFKSADINLIQSRHHIMMS